MRALRDAVRAVAASPTPPPDARAFASALSLLSVAYGRVSAARRWAYEVGLLTATSVPAPVVSVGNVTWGGSGKTPMAELVAREMAAAGATPAVLSRGYRGGDEAWMLRRRLADVRGARVLVGAYRVKLALEALAGYGGGDAARRAPETHIEPSSPEHSHPATHSPVAFAREAKFAGDVDVDDVALRCVDPAKAAATTAAAERTSTTAAPLASSARPPVPRDPSRVAALVLDDGAQHLRLRRDLEIITVNAISRWGSGALVPRGPLRERPGDVIRRADVVVLHHADLARALDPEAASTFEREIERHVADARAHRTTKASEASESDDASDASDASDARSAASSFDAPILVRSSMRATGVERLARYLGTSPPHEWTPPLTRLRGSRLLCPCGVGSAAAVRATLASLAAPAPSGDPRAFGLRIRTTGVAEVMDLGDHEVFREEDLRRAAERFREMHRESGEVGGAEARMVLLEKDAARIRAGGAEAAARALAILAPADPLVLKAEIAIDSEKDREAIRGAIRGALERGRRRAKSGEG